MPRYLFHVFNDDQTTDVEGQVLPDLDTARTMAVQAARAIMADELQTRGKIDLRHWIEIEDEAGNMTVVAFYEAVTIRPLAP